MLSRFRSFVVIAAATTAACAPAVMKLPSGQGAPVDARDAVLDATTVCTGVRTFSAEVGVSGSAGGQRLRGRLLVGAAAPDSARIEAIAPFGPPVFIFVARNQEATLLLPRDERVLEHGKPSQVLEAVSGLPLDAADLRRALTACLSDPRPGDGRAIGEDWRVVPDPPDTAYLRRDSRGASWRVVAVIHTPSDGLPWRAEYTAFEGGLPRGVRLISTDSKRFDLRLALSQVDVNPSLDADAFRVQVPRSASPITIEELQNARPGIRKD